MSSSPVAVVVTQLLCTVAETRERVKTGRAGENQYSRLVRLKKIKEWTCLRAVAAAEKLVRWQPSGELFGGHLRGEK